MAGIDKIYGTTYQYDELYNWMKENIPKGKEYYLHYFYPRVGDEDDDDQPIARFSKEVDIWLLQTCPIPWVIEAIKFQYNIK